MIVDLFGKVPPPVTIEVDLKGQVADMARELKLRETLYPKWVASGRMTQPDADRQIAAARAILATLLLLTAPSEGLLERMARAHDEEDSAQRGEPSPWRADLNPPGPASAAFMAERRSAMRCALEAFPKESTR